MHGGYGLVGNVVVNASNVVGKSVVVDIVVVLVGIL